MAAPPDPPLRLRLEAAGQAHLWVHAQALPEPARAAFLEELGRHPWTEVAQALRTDARRPRWELRPPQALTLRRQEAVGGLRPRLARLGAQRLHAGEVATLLLAGGQGSRLGHPGPKGALRLGPEDDRTLFAILVERVVAAGRAAGRPVPLLVLVARDTEDLTRQLFEEHGAAWGLLPGQARFVRQGALPAVDLEGRALLQAPGRLALAPDGHGGALRALAAQGVLAELAHSGVRVLTTFQVDNPLARPLDPVMLGWMVERQAQVVGKAVRKQDAAERVGVFARDLAGRTRVVEYSELEGVEGAEALLLGSIAVHALDLTWLHALAQAGPLPLPLHVARRRVAALATHGGAGEPQEQDALKLERFLFDVFPAAERVEVQEVARAREFAPIKNAQGEDSPDSARRLVEQEVRRWYRRRGLPEPSVPSLRPLVMDGDGSDGAG